MLPVITSILYATDLSETAEHALHFAAAIAARQGAELTVLHVLPDELEMYSEEAGFDIAAVFGEEAARMIDRGDVENAKKAIGTRIRQTISGCLHPETLDRVFGGKKIIVTAGDPAAEILKEASSEKYQLLVLGTHGLSGWTSMMVGSVAGQVAKHGRIPTMVVPLPGKIRADSAGEAEPAEAKA